MRAVRILLNKSVRVSTALAELCEEREDIITRAPDTPVRTPRYPPTFGGDNRSYRDVHDVPRRYDGHNARGLAGSFAFEEMARGLGARDLGQVQRNLPSAAMLAPLSQNNGLSPRPSTRGRARAGKTGGYQGGRAASHHPHEALMSSTRSESGEATNVSAFETTHSTSQPSNGITASSARSSPSFSPAVPRGLGGSNGVGEAFAFGSEISFGSESFRLHPHSPSVNATMGPLNGNEMGGARTSRSFSETLNRSKSLPRSSAQEESAPRRSEAGTSASTPVKAKDDAGDQQAESARESAVTARAQAQYGCPLPSQTAYGSYSQQYSYPEYYPSSLEQSSVSVGRQSPTSQSSSYDHQNQQVYQQYTPYYSNQPPWNVMPIYPGGPTGYGESIAPEIRKQKKRGGGGSVKSLPNGASNYGNRQSDHEPFQLDDSEEMGYSSPEGEEEDSPRNHTFDTMSGYPPPSMSPIALQPQSQAFQGEQQQDEDYDQTISQIEMTIPNEDDVLTPKGDSTDPRPIASSFSLQQQETTPEGSSRETQ